MEIFTLFISLFDYEFILRIIGSVEGKWYHIIRLINEESFYRRKIGFSLFWGVIRIFINIPFVRKVE